MPNTTEKSFQLIRPIHYRSFADGSLIIFDEFTSQTYQLADYVTPLLKLFVFKYKRNEACVLNDILMLAQQEQANVEDYQKIIESLIQLDILAVEALEHSQ